MASQKNVPKLNDTKFLKRPTIKFGRLTDRDRLCLNCLNLTHMAHSLATTPEVVRFWRERFGLPAVNILGQEFFDIRAVREWCDKVDIEQLCRMTPGNLLPKQITVLPDNSLDLSVGRFWLIPVRDDESAKSGEASDDA